MDLRYSILKGHDADLALTPQGTYLLTWNHQIKGFGPFETKSLLTPFKVEVPNGWSALVLAHHSLAHEGWLVHQAVVNTSGRTVIGVTVTNLTGHRRPFPSGGLFELAVVKYYGGRPGRVDGMGVMPECDDNGVTVVRFNATVARVGPGGNLAG